MGRDPAQLADRVLEVVDGRADAAVRVTHLRHGLTRFANSFVHQHVGEDAVTVDLQVAIESRTASASTSRVDDDGIAALVSNVLDLAALMRPDELHPGVAPPQELVHRPRLGGGTVAVRPEQRADAVAAFVAADRELSAAGYVETQHVTTAFANTAGQRVAADTTRASLDGIHQTSNSAGSAHATHQDLTALDGAAAGYRAADLARRGKDPVDLDPDRFEVVLGPDAVATILLFLGVYGFNARAVAERRSFVRLGEPQLDPAIDLVDDPTDRRSVGLTFDVEGTPKRRYELVREGRPVGLAHDRRTAKAAGTESTGHHVPGSQRLGPVPTDLVLRPGDAAPDELVAGVRRGLMVTTFNYCRVLDPRTLAVTGLTRNGTFLIEDGEVTRPVGNLRFTQSFVEALAPGRVVGIGNDDRYADSEFGPGFVITPSLRLATWRFTGGAGG